MIPYKNLIVPVDFSDNSLVALEEAQRVASDGAKVHVLHVLPQLSSLEPGMVWDTLDDASRVENTTKALKQFIDDAGYGGAELHVLVSSASPAVEIAEAVEAIGADVIVIASHGRTGLARLALGSVCERVVRLAHCPVIVVKASPEKN